MRRFFQWLLPVVALAELHKYNAIDSETVLNVHVVPHSHDDVGWLKTVEQYYYPHQNTTISPNSVQKILTTTIDALQQDAARTFVLVEIKFFSMWWNEQNEAVRDAVRFLVANQQLTFVNAGWCMHDEAATHFVGMVDQMTAGHAFLEQTLGVVPTVGWQLDPFGHSATQASLMTSRMGFDAVYMGRIDYQDLTLRHLTQQCEGLWDASESLNDATVFWGLTGSYSGNYGPPEGFCFDAYCDPKQQLLGLDEDALLERLQNFLQQLRAQSDRTSDNHIMLTMGEDFNVSQMYLSNELLCFTKSISCVVAVHGRFVEFCQSGFIDSQAHDTPALGSSGHVIFFRPPVQSFEHLLFFTGILHSAKKQCMEASARAK